MNRQEVIDSGLIEQYILGELSSEDRQLIEKKLLSDKELKAYYEQLQSDLEKLAFENAVTPPKQIKEILMSNLSELVNNSSEIKPKLQPEKRKFSWPLSIAASAAIAFLAAAVIFYQQLGEVKSQNNKLAKEKRLLIEELEKSARQLTVTNKWYEAINDPAVVRFTLVGNQLSPNAKAITYINHQAKSVVVNAIELPLLKEDETYQVWADVEGVMIDMGVIKPGTEMISLNYIDHAESVNLTIEPKGGSDHPTVERLIANTFL